MIKILAPMDDVTDTVFRRVVADCAAPDLTVTEFVNVDGLCSPGRPNLMRKLDNSLDTAPVYAQIWGKKPENFETIAREIADGTIPGFAGIDINFGCPAKSEVKAGTCSALIQKELRPEAKKILDSVMKGAGDFPVSFKTRLGFTEVDYTWHEFLLGYKPKMLTVHVRTKSEMSKVPARWEAIAPILELRDKLSQNTKIIMNGDIRDAKHGEVIAENYGVDGVMIGRGIFHNPFAFADDPTVWERKSKEERIELFIRHLRLFQETYPKGERPFNPLKKFAKVYISDFPGASEMRARIMDAQSVNEAISLID